ncbi:DeoR/GlpR family DNA-binding transcription regulator [Oerskovia flava]|uniref:DeoR/GlpR family DNA-binding transcription regulator n=1 Tax=Oerskovia flava TaxID=2986422 RepID=UPI00223F0971|nr:DeoR/GlpR family DNA-binding transcription regulator [Oerskovia sp. JB1-3-2]
MLASQRHEHILAQIREHGAVRISELTVALDVSDMTVRRDLVELAERGLVRKVHGGAVAPHTTSHEPGFAVKSTLATAEKQAIAVAAAQLVAPGSSIALGAGTTTHLLAQALVALPAVRPLTVVTNSVPVAETFHRAGDPRIETLLTGGARTPSDALVGPIAESSLAELRVDHVFLGTHGVSVEAGLTTPNLDEAATNRAMIASGAQTVVLADHTKWQTTGLRVFATLAEVDVLVTDTGLAPADQEEVRALVERLVLAPTPTAPSPAGTPAGSTPQTEGTTR